MSKALVKFSLFFDPTETWDRISSLEADFSVFLSSKGLEAEKIQTVNSSSEIIMLVRKAPEVPPPVMPEKPKKPSQMLKEMSKK
jgi:hypothetical protein